MWRKTDAPPSSLPQETVAHSRPEAANREPAPAPRSLEGTHLGKTISIKGEITGRENLFLDGELSGTIRLADARLTIGPSGHLRADAEGQEIEVHGEVHGTLLGRERVRIGRTGRVTGDIVTPRIAVEEGAVISGSVDVTRPGEVRVAKPAAAAPSTAVNAVSVVKESAGAGASREPIQ